MKNYRQLRTQGGTILVLSALTLFMLAAFASLAIDSSLLYVARNELQNAADAGALAATRVLYVNDGTAVNPGANQVGHDVAESNYSQNLPVEVDWTSGNTGDVQRGHWSFATRQFTPNASLLAVDLFDVTTAELDADLNFINAVKVTTRRELNPVQLVLARLFGIDSSVMATDAVAYIGFAGSLQPTEVDQPIAICKDKITHNGDQSFTCSVGTFIPSADNQSLSETGGWTDFNQENACAGGASSNTVKPLICASGNPVQVFFGQDMATIGGQVQSAFNPFWDCWDDETEQTAPWNMTLPVIECPDSNVGPCNTLVGAVNVNVLFVVDKANKIDDDAPTEMNCSAGGYSCQDWSNDDPSGIVRWNDFVNFYQIQRPDGSVAEYDDHQPDSGWRQKTIYFLPDCGLHEPTGHTGGENFGILAKVPVLVE